MPTEVLGDGFIILTNPPFRSIHAYTEPLCRQTCLLSLEGGKISVDIQPPRNPFERIDHPITVLIQLLKMIVAQVASLRVRDAPFASRRAGIVALWFFQHAVVG